MEGEFGCDAREQFVAAWVAPEDEIAVGDVGIGDGSVVLGGSVAAELETPFSDGVGHCGGGPFADLVVHGFSGRTDHDEGVHEGIVDWALEAMTFSYTPVGRPCNQSPAILLFFEMDCPGTVKRSFRYLDELIIEDDFWRSIVNKRTEAVRHRKSEGRDIGGGCVDEAG